MKWAVTQYKIFEYTAQSKCIIVSTSSSGIVKYEFPFVKTGLVPHCQNIPKAYTEIIPLKPEKVQDVSRMIDIIPLQFLEYFDTILRKFGNNETTGEEQNYKSGSEVWDRITVILISFFIKMFILFNLLRSVVQYTVLHI